MAVTLLLFRKVVMESRQVMPLLHMKTICLGCSGRRLSGQSRAGGVPPQLPIWDRQNSRRTERTCKKLKLCPPQVLRSKTFVPLVPLVPPRHLVSATNWRYSNSSATRTRQQFLSIFFSHVTLGHLVSAVNEVHPMCRQPCIALMSGGTPTENPTTAGVAGTPNETPTTLGDETMLSNGAGIANPETDAGWT